MAILYAATRPDVIIGLVCHRETDAAAAILVLRQTIATTYMEESKPKYQMVHSPQNSDISSRCSAMMKPQLLLLTTPAIFRVRKWRRKQYWHPADFGSAEERI